MATREQVQNTMATVEAMVNGAAAVMQRIHPEVKIRSWNELTPGEQHRLAAAWQPSLAPLATILSGRVGTGENGIEVGLG